MQPTSVEFLKITIVCKHDGDDSFWEEEFIYKANIHADKRKVRTILFVTQCLDHIMDNRPKSEDAIILIKNFEWYIPKKETIIEI